MIHGLLKLRLGQGFQLGTRMHGLFVRGLDAYLFGNGLRGLRPAPDSVILVRNAV